MNLPLLTSRSRVMMFAPHPDDESLAAGIFLQRAAAAGATVRVIYATNGERNCWPQRLLERKLRLRESDRRRWGARRQREALAALGLLGFGPDQVEFLSLPDQGLTDLLLQGSEATLRRLAHTHPAVGTDPSAPAFGRRHASRPQWTGDSARARDCSLPRTAASFDPPPLSRPRRERIVPPRRLRTAAQRFGKAGKAARNRLPPHPGRALAPALPFLCPTPGAVRDRPRKNVAGWRQSDPLQRARSSCAALASRLYPQAVAGGRDFTLSPRPRPRGRLATPPRDAPRAPRPARPDRSRDW